MKLSIYPQRKLHIWNPNTAPNSELWVVFNLNKEFSELSRAAHTHSHPAEWQCFPQNLPENANLNPKFTFLEGGDGQPIITDSRISQVFR